MGRNALYWSNTANDIIVQLELSLVNSIQLNSFTEAFSCRGGRSLGRKFPQSHRIRTNWRPHRSTRRHCSRCNVPLVANLRILSLLTANSGRNCCNVCPKTSSLTQFSHSTVTISAHHLDLYIDVCGIIHWSLPHFKESTIHATGRETDAFHWFRL